jgi:DNA repair/transcription protein MET18/MMS19
LKSSAAALDALCVTSHINSAHIIDITLPSLIDRLPETSEGSSPMTYLHVLYALRIICPVPSIYKHAIPLLIQKFDTVCEKGKLYYGFY